ncbi:MAG: hypothetical protein KC619_20335 [Myxococcales bacterium]|nr:hypothetical protein [Myxococcales bacterium]
MRPPWLDRTQSTSLGRAGRTSKTAAPRRSRRPQRKSAWQTFLDETQTHATLGVLIRVAREPAFREVAARARRRARR